MKKARLLIALALVSAAAVAAAPAYRNHVSLGFYNAMLPLTARSGERSLGVEGRYERDLNGYWALFVGIDTLLLTAGVRVYPLGGFGWLYADAAVPTNVVDMFGSYGGDVVFPIIRVGWRFRLSDKLTLSPAAGASASLGEKAGFDPGAGDVEVNAVVGLDVGGLF